MTVLEAIQRSTGFLAGKGLESPRLDAELLLAEVLGLRRMQLYLNFERPLTEPETGAYREFIRRRAQREPLQHIVGSTSFCGFEIGVSRRALVPRPETELLAEEGWKFLQEIAKQGAAHPAALDFGTGSGCIAIALARNCPDLAVYALEVSAETLEDAKANAARNQVAERIQFLEGDGFAGVPAGASFDLIISNPPYIPSGEIGGLQPEVKDFDPHEALDGGPDGLDFYRSLADEAKPFLKENGRLLIEFGDGQAGPIREIFENQKWIVAAIREDYTRRPRLMILKTTQSPAAAQSGEHTAADQPQFPR